MGLMPPRKFPSPLAVPIGLLLLLAACSGDNPGESNARLESAQAAAMPVQAVEVAPRDLSRTVRVSAQVQPLRLIRLASRTGGVLDEVLVEEGDRVQRDQIIARIDVAEQQAELARARARLEERELSLERMSRLRARAHVDEASFEAARAEYAIAESEVLLWQTRVDFGTVKSTIDGTVIARHVEPGEAIAVHAPLFELSDLENLVLRLGVSELDVGELAVGDAVEVHMDALHDASAFNGRVRRIFPAAEASSRLVTVEVALPDAAARGVRPGFLARATLQVDRRDGALAVPAAALAEQAGGYYVMVIDADNRLERRPVEPGVGRGMWQEILDGLEPGEHVIATNPLDLNEGSRVRIVGWAG